MQQLMAQAQRMQAQMEQKKAELDQQEFTAGAGGGVVTATVNGAKAALLDWGSPLRWWILRMWRCCPIWSLLL